MPDPSKPTDTHAAPDPFHRPPLTPEDQIAGDMHTEEPMGWDLAPQDISDPQFKRHPRPDRIGGLKPADPKSP